MNSLGTLDERAISTMSTRPAVPHDTSHERRTVFIPSHVARNLPDFPSVIAVPARPFQSQDVRRTADKHICILGLYVEIHTVNNAVRPHSEVLLEFEPWEDPVPPACSGRVSSRASAWHVPQT